MQFDFRSLKVTKTSNLQQYVGLGPCPALLLYSLPFRTDLVSGLWFVLWSIPPGLWGIVLGHSVEVPSAGEDDLSVWSGLATLYWLPLYNYWSSSEQEVQSVCANGGIDWMWHIKEKEKKREKPAKERLDKSKNKTIFRLELVEQIGRTEIG